MENVNNSNVAVKEKETTTQKRNVKVKGGLLYRFTKRFFDILLSSIFLLAFGWIILILLFIKFCEDGHNPIYTSKRVGKGGKIFKFHKIRSMKPNAEKLKKQMIKDGLNEADGPVFKMKDDPRITKFGKFLRKTSLDELPQIWDVFLGRMSIVGPRPPLPEEVRNYSDYQMHRLDVKGGLICTWQITPHRHDLSFDEWVELDIKYIESRSLWKDIGIIFKAFIFVLTDRTGE